jgi:hypothetical protein
VEVPTRRWTHRANEIIFGRFFTPSQNDDGARQTGLNNGPNGYHNWAGNTPIGLHWWMITK